jgi:hypothetical protein
MPMGGDGVWRYIGSEEFFELECGCVEESHSVQRQKALTSLVCSFRLGNLNTK